MQYPYLLWNSDSGVSKLRTPNYDSDSISKIIWTPTPNPKSDSDSRTYCVT